MFTFGRDKERLEPWIMFRYAMAVALTVGVPRHACARRTWVARR